MAVHMTEIAWHDLIEDAADLPESDQYYICTVEYDDGDHFEVEILWFDTNTGLWYLNDIEDDPVEGIEVVAWCDFDRSGFPYVHKE